MAQLTFPITKPGLIVPVWIGQSGLMTTSILAAGQSPLPPVQARGLLDTGADVTAIAGWIVRKLAIPSSSTASTHTAAGELEVRVYKVSLGITDPNQAELTWLMQPDLLVTELANELPDVDVLIGLDVLLEYKLFVDGPARQFTLD